MRLLSALLLRPGLVAGSLVIAGASAAIIINALGNQSSRHRYPIFAKAERSSAERRSESATPLAAPTPPSRPVLVSPTPAPPQAPPRAAGRDLIGEMIRASDTTGSAPPAARPAEGPPEAQRLVAAAQRALVKLGYGPLKTDGVFGSGTRQAIERFERDRRLTPTGDLGPRTVRELSAQSGIRVE